MSIFQAVRLALASLLVFLFAATAQATETTPPPAPAKLVKIAVLGDSLADGLYSGLYQIEKAEAPNVEVTKRTRINTGLVHLNKYDWLGLASDIAKAKEFDVVVISFGANDLVSFRDRKPPVHYGTEGWPAAYRERVFTLSKTLVDAGIKTVWVGLPITRPDRFQKDFAFLNGIFKEAVTAAGGNYLDVWNAFAENGAYTEKGKNLEGATAILRHTDGVHFTPEGYFVYGKLVRDEMAKLGIK